VEHRSAPRANLGRDGSSLLHLSQCSPCGRKQGYTRRCQRDARRTEEEGRTETIFKLANLLAERRLREVKPLCSAGEAELLSDGNEIAKVAKLDIE